MMGRDVNKKAKEGLPIKGIADNGILSYSIDDDGNVKLPKGLTKDVLTAIVKDVVEDMYAEKKHKVTSMSDTDWFEDMERMYLGLSQIVPSMLKRGERDEG